MQAKKISPQDSARILEFLDSILTSSENFRQQVLISLKQIFGYQRATFFLIDQHSKMHAPTMLNIDDTLCADYFRYYCKQDIFHPDRVANKVSRKNVLTVKDVMPIPSFINTEYYNDFLQMQDIYHEIAVFLLEENRPIGIIGLYRSAREKPFSEHDIMVLQNISTHISRTLSSYLQIADSQVYKEIFKSSSHYLPIGFLVFDRALNIHYSNDAAMEICRDFTAGDKQNVSCRKFLEQFLAGDMDWHPGLKKTMLSPSLKKYVATILPAANHSLKGAELLTACILPSNFSLQGFLNKQSSGSQDTFSRRETEILSLVLEGLNNREIADRLLISVHTVKTHLQNIYKKMEVKNRTSLCYKINTLYGNDHLTGF